MSDLLERGTLRPGEELVIRRRSAPAIEGRVEGNGRIKVGQSSHDTPSAAAKYALGVRSADGWLRWRVPRLNHCTLADLRGPVSR